MTKKNKIDLIRILLSAVLFTIGFFIENNIAKIVILMTAYIIVGYDILWTAVRNIFHGQVFDENFLMSLATIGALALQQFSEAVAVMLFYQVGELFQNYAVNRSRRSIKALMDICPDYAWVLRDEKFIKVAPEELKIGDVVLVKAGEKISIDGEVIEGSTLIDTSALTGESIPRELNVGDKALSGAVNQYGTIKIRVEKLFEDSTVSKILELVESASSKKAKTEKFITKFAKYYTPAVVISAVMLAFIPPIFVGDFAKWIHRALVFLVVSCPCALVISVPIGFFGGIGGASKLGILIKGSSYMEVLAKVNTFVFDKTGTLTKGNFAITEIMPNKISKEQLIDYCAHAEAYSNHPLAKAVVKLKNIDSNRIGNAEEIAGKGIKAEVDGKIILCGNEKLMNANNINCDVIMNNAVIHVAIDKKYAGYITFADEIKDDTKDTINALKNIGIEKTIMLTGDNKKVAENVASAIHIDDVKAELLPEDKVLALEDIIKNKKQNQMVAYVGDGINDAPVLARADVGIAMGGLGSDAAIDIADIVIMNDEPKKIIDAIKISKKTLRIVKENIIFTLIVKAVVLVLGAMGIASMWGAVFADVGVAVLAILNSIRTLSTKKISN